MDLTLALVTLASLAIATAMSLVAWRVVREARERTLARAEVLRTLAALEFAQPPAPPLAPAGPVPEPPARDERPVARPSRKQEPADTRLGLFDFEDANEWNTGDEFDVPWEAPAATAPGPMFEATAEPRAPGRRWLALAAVGAFMAAGAGGLYALHASGALSGLTAPGSGVARRAPGSPPLELLSLSNSIDQAGNFTVTGLVDNPLAGRPLHDIVAVVYLFDPQGRYFASGRAKLEQSALPPGEESPFTVRIRVGTAVSRYRIGFRLEDGGVVQHVDHRTGTSANPAAPGSTNGV